jgi:hypothetical protein
MASGATITSVDTFTIRQDRTVAFDPASLAWTFSSPQKPTAIALYSQTVSVSQQVKLDGTRSTDSNGTPLSLRPLLVDHQLRNWQGWISDGRRISSGC